MPQIIDKLKGAKTFHRLCGEGNHSYVIQAELVVDITDACDMKRQHAVMVFARDREKKILVMLKSVDNLNSLNGHTRVFELEVYKRGLSSLKRFCDWARGRGIEPDRLCDLVMEFAPK
ncbi:MAG: hypothetical protein HGA33_03745 [Candidatus Moranbacteria bacterium]|nr:hypothetical protein [Candidatus Moranbacteria bacterium]